MYVCVVYVIFCCKDLPVLIIHESAKQLYYGRQGVGQLFINYYYILYVGVLFLINESMKNHADCGELPCIEGLLRLLLVLYIRINMLT